MLGELGHISLIVGTVAALLAGVSYFYAFDSQLPEVKNWKKIGRWAYGVHIISVMLAVLTLFVIIYDHQFQYYYAWKHSSKLLPVYYIISCFWEGQEGSFLIWIFWNALIGGIVLKTSKNRESATMMVIATIQVFLLSMILGVLIWDWKIGNSPFTLLRDVMTDPMFRIDPDFVPNDGTGLNPLLQNIWMVIHPPIIFLGFSLSQVPFAYCLAGLISSDLKGWVSKAQIWLATAVGVLGLGIMMGAYWAYETLNFGGYWNWDPVENAILIPWLVMLGAMHGLLIYQKKKQGLMFSAILVLSSFVLVVYATFLTRSGILGDSSVHSFTDLGLSGQLLIFLLVVSIVSAIAVFKRKDEFLINSDTISKYDFEFWLIVGVLVLCLSAFQVLLPTSIPVFSAIIETLGFESRMAPPANPVEFYSKFQLWFAVAFGVLMGLAQLLYWERPKGKKELEDKMIFPVVVTLVLSSVIVLLGRVRDWQYIILITSVIFGFAVSVSIVYKNFNLGQKLGGPLSHIGFTVLVMGFVFSAGYSKLISSNLTINAPESSLPIHTIQEHALLNRNISKELGSYKFTYLGTKVGVQQSEHMIDKDNLINTNYGEFKVLKQDVYTDDGVIEKGATVKVDAENVYYEIAVQKGNDRFVLKPRLQNNPNMGYIASPDIHSFWNKDIYVHVSNFPDPEKVTWKNPTTFKLKPFESFNFHGLTITLNDSYLVDELVGIEVKPNDYAVSMNFAVVDGQNSYLMSPIYLISGDQVRLYPDENKALGLKLAANKIDPKTGEVTVDISSSQRDWITIKAQEMPLINLVWIGTLIMVFGVSVAVSGRIGLRWKPSNFVMKVAHRNQIKKMSSYLRGKEMVKRKA